MTDPIRPAPGSNGPAPTSREERLAAKLRENLRRRKAQARAQTPPAPPEPAPGEESAALSKPAPNS